MHDEIRTPGLIRPLSNVTEKDIKHQILEQRASSKGKEICERMKEMRIALAEANGIVFYTKMCEHRGPCAGTCHVCDGEMRYINQELSKMSPEERVYPQQFISLGNGVFR